MSFGVLAGAKIKYLELTSTSGRPASVKEIISGASGVLLAPMTAKTFNFPLFACSLTLENVNMAIFTWPAKTSTNAGPLPL